ncbi:VPS53, partial [Symbiodinium sp. KB8]
MAAELEPAGQPKQWRAAKQTDTPVAPGGAAATGQSLRGPPMALAALENHAIELSDDVEELPGSRAVLRRAEMRLGGAQLLIPHGFKHADPAAWPSAQLPPPPFPVERPSRPRMPCRRWRRAVPAAGAQGILRLLHECCFIRVCFCCFRLFSAQIAASPGNDGGAVLGDLGPEFRLIESRSGAAAARADPMAELDVADFDPVEYLNKHFPDEASLAGGRLEATLRQWDYEVRRLDEQALDAVRAQAVAGAHAAKDVDHARASVLDLFDKVGEIKRRADDAERMADEICRDIRDLDTAKTHLASTLAGVKNLQLLCTSVAQLQRAVAERQYAGAGQLLSLVRQLIGVSFARYHKSPVIAALADAETAVRSRLRELMAEQFEAAVKRLADACEVVDALGGQCLADRVAAMVRKFLRPYSQAFGGDNAKGDGPGALANADRRFAWFRRTLREFESRYGPVPRRLCNAFVDMTRADFEAELAAYDPPDSAPPEALLRALQRSIEFEAQMARRFEAKPPSADQSADGGTASAASAAASAAAAGAAASGAGGGGLAGAVLAAASAAGHDTSEWAEQAEQRRQARADKKARRRFLKQLGGSAGGGGAVRDVGLDAAGLGLMTALPALPPLKRRLASAFEPNMGSYVRLEASRLDDVITSAAKNPDADSAATFGDEDDDMSGSAGMAGSAGSLALFASSTRLFVQLRGAVERCCQLSRGQTLFAVFKASRSALERYAAVLEGRLPKPQRGGSALGALPARTEADVERAVTYSTPATIDEAALATVRRLCLVVNTAEFCGESAPQLAELVIGRADAEFAEHVSADAIEDRFFEVAAQAVRALAAWTWSAVDRDLVDMVRTDWFRVVDIGDQSPFVGSIDRKLCAIFPVVRQLLGGGYFRQFCDHFVRGFAHRFMSALYKPRSCIGEVGAQQLLLDTQTLRVVLLQAPLALTEEEADAETQLPPAPSSYVRFVKAELPRAELLLKLVGTPPEALPANVRAMWPRASRADLERVMTLKGMPRKAMLPVVAELGLDGAATPGAAGPAAGRPGNPFASPATPAGGAAGAVVG